MITECKDRCFFFKAKKFAIVFLAVLLSFPLAINADNNNLAVKAKLVGGYIVPQGMYKSQMGINSLVAGAELDIEFLNLGVENWSHHWGFPTFGMAITGLNLGDGRLLGQTGMFTGYMDWNVVDTRNFVLGLRVGGGFAGFSKLSPMLGSWASLAMTTGIKLEFPIGYSHGILFDFGSIHLNNGEMRYPNSTMNIVYGSIGYKNRIGSEYRRTNIPLYRKDLQYDMMVNITAKGGAHHYYFTNKNDHAKFFALHADVVWKMTNCYGLGLGVDAFYNEAFVQQGVDNNVVYDKHTPNTRYFIETDNFLNKMRVGLVFANVFTMGRVTFLFDAGLYLYDPIKNCYPSTVIDKTKDRRLPIYGFNPTKEDGWAYFRAGMRVRLFSNVYVSASYKTHLMKAEGIEFGIGYSIPMKKSNYMRNPRTGKYQKWKLLYPRHNKGYAY